MESVENENNEQTSVEQAAQAPDVATGGAANDSTPDVQEVVTDQQGDVPADQLASDGDQVQPGLDETTEPGA